MKKNFFSLTMVAVLMLSACMPISTTIATKEIPASTLLPSTAIAVPPTPTPEGKTLLVTSPANGSGTLRQAMLDAQNGDTRAVIRRLASRSDDTPGVSLLVRAAGAGGYGGLVSLDIVYLNVYAS